MKVLVTGGAGFIGSFTVDALVERGHDVRVFDSLEPQVHGNSGALPPYWNAASEFVSGDVRNRDALKKALQDVHAVIHLAAAVGVGQSMYEIQRYVSANTLGTANLLDILANEKHRVTKLVVASSMSIYGEGKYVCKQCGVVYPQSRSKVQLEEKRWEMTCPTCNAIVEPAPTGEEKPLHSTSIYAISKKDQEEMCLCVGPAYGISTIALRYFNVYGPRQALSNPYTGVGAIFSSRLINHRPPIVFEDGLQTRDFVHVSDIAQANLLALSNDKVKSDVFNVGTGRRLTILDIARVLSSKLEFGQPPNITGQFRSGDIRHCFADISKIKRALGFQPRVQFEDGVSDLVDWVKRQEARDGTQRALQQLERRGLISR